MSEDTKDRIKIGSLWQSDLKDGGIYLSGSFTYGTELLVWPNKFKKTDKEPDYVVYLCKREKKDFKPKGEKEAPDIGSAVFPPEINDIPF